MNPLRGSVLAGLLLSIFFPFLPLQGQVGEAFLEEHQDRMEALFSELDPEREGIREITALWEAGKQVAACNALSEYFNKKSFPLSLLDKPLIPADVILRAEAALENKFFLLNRWEQAAVTPSGSIDWEGRGARDDKERAWMLNRHAFLLHLAEAEKSTGRQQFRLATNALMSDWIFQNPYPNRLSFSAPWRALEVSRRILNSWVYLFYGYDILDDETRLLVLSSVLDHADSLDEHTSFWGGNHLITEKMALLALATAWPEFKQASQWRSEAIARISSEFIAQTYPDGSYKELSNHYQRVVLTNTIKFLKLLDTNGQSEADQEVVQRIEKMWDFFAGVMRPDGLGPLNNASDIEDNAAFVKTIWSRFDRPDWLYMATNGTEGTAPSGPETNPSRLFPWAGQAILRTGWDRGAGWVYFDAGPYGTAHQHSDRLHVSAALEGRPLLVDNGRYVYQPGPWKDYFQGPSGHNTLLLNGQPAAQAPREVQTPLPLIFEKHRSAVFAAATAYFQPRPSMSLLPELTASVPWTRSVLLDHKGRFVLFIDYLVSFKKQPWTAHWHFHPDIKKEEAARALKLVNPTDSVRADFHVGSRQPAIAGFYSPEYNLKQPAVQWNVSGMTNGPTHLIWLLQAPAQSMIEVKILSAPNDPILHLEVWRKALKIAEIHLDLLADPVSIEYKAD